MAGGPGEDHQSAVGDVARATARRVRAGVIRREFCRRCWSEPSDWRAPVAEAVGAGVDHADVDRGSRLTVGEAGLGRDEPDAWAADGERRRPRARAVDLAGGRAAVVDGLDHPAADRAGADAWVAAQGPAVKLAAEGGSAGADDEIRAVGSGAARSAQRRRSDRSRSSRRVRAGRTEQTEDRRPGTPASRTRRR